jgi:hypothetical protein
LSIGGTGDGAYTIKPLENSILTIRSADDLQIYMKATLGSGDLIPVGTTGAAYPNFKADLTNIVITNAGKALNSAVLNAILNSGTMMLDFEFSLLGAIGPDYFSFSQMLAGDKSGSGGFCGAMTIPEPATIALMGLGALAFIRKRKS